MRSVDDVFDVLGGPAEVGRIIGKSTEHAASMKRRGSIPVAYWPSIIAAARAARVSGVTYESLAKLHATGAARAKECVR